MAKTIKNNIYYDNQNTITKDKILRTSRLPPTQILEDNTHQYVIKTEENISFFSPLRFERLVSYFIFHFIEN